MDNMRLGAAMAATLKSFRPNPGTAVTDGVLTQMWQDVAQDIIDEINNHADIVLEAADISVLPGTFKDSLNNPVTGTGNNDAVTLEGKIE